MTRALPSPCPARPQPVWCPNASLSDPGITALPSALPQTATGTDARPAAHVPAHHGCHPSGASLV